MRRRSTLIAPALVLLGVACGGGAARETVNFEQIQHDLEAYLPLLARAYSADEYEPLREHAAVKEVARVEKTVRELAAQGRRLEPTFRQLTVEKHRVVNNSNAYATTVEVWDLKVYITGTDTVVSQVDGQRYRGRYQLKRDGEGWRVLFRTVEEI